MNKVAEKGYFYIAYGEAFTKEALNMTPPSSSLVRITDSSKRHTAGAIGHEALRSF